MKKCQSALEYLMVYGWVFIIIVVVGAALYFLGVFSPQSDNKALTEQSFETDEVGILDHQLLEDGTWTLSLFSRGYDVIITSVIIDNQTFTFNEYLPNGAIKIIRAKLNHTLDFGDSYMNKMFIGYKKVTTRLDHYASGLFSGIVESGSFNITTPASINNFFQTTQADFSLGTPSGADTAKIPGYITLSRKNDWFYDTYNNRKIITFAEKSGNNLLNYPVSFTIDTASLISSAKMQADGSDIRIVMNNVEIPYQLESETLNTQSTKVWILLSISSYSNQQIHLYYNNPSTASPNYAAEIITSSGQEGHFENNKIYASIGNDNNPSKWGFDTIYDKSTGRDLVNYHTFLFNRDNSQPHSVIVTRNGPIFAELSMSGSGDIENNGPLIYRLFSQNNFIRWQHNKTINYNDAFYLGTDNNEADTIETNGVILPLANNSVNNIDYSYIREYNISSNYGILMTSPVYLNSAIVIEDSGREYLGLYNNSAANAPYFDYYIGVFSQEECEKTARITNHQPTFTAGIEEGPYVLSATFTSNTYNTGIENPNYNTLSIWGSKNVYGDYKIQLRAGISELDCLNAEWYGPTSTLDYYTTNSTINNIHNGKSWIQYRVYLSTINSVISPYFDAININYS